MHVTVGFLLTLVTWLGLRRLVGAPLLGRRGDARGLALFLDALAPFAGFLLFILPTARPILAGLAVAALGVGMGVADRVKRLVLDEPVVFADRAELLEVVRHPRLYLAFVGFWPMAGGTAAIAAAVALLVHLEPPLWRMDLFQALAIAIGVGLVIRLMFVVPTAPPIRSALGRRYAALAPSREPKGDAARFGLFAACTIQATLARVERPTRQAAARARRWAPIPADAGPIVVVQGESFVDAARLHPDLAALLPHFRQLRAEAHAHGRLEVPCWGANTIRSELAVLAALGPADVGLDRYNPYEHFARVPLPTLAAQARAAGYRTVCLHPYNRAFYARDRVMPMLGFDEFVGIEGFEGAETLGPYVSDRAVAERAAALLREHGPRLFLFIVTMENHGPWDASHDAVPPVPLPDAWAAGRDAAAVGRWLAHLRSTDAMIPILREAIGAKGWLLMYGDHQPSLAGPFHAPGLPDRRTDYALWSADGGDGARIDRAAEELAPALLALLSAGGGTQQAGEAALPGTGAREPGGARPPAGGEAR
jgi:hypothetical protein